MLARLVKFGAFELDSASGELRKHGIKIKLQEQPLQILHRLLESPGQVVAREELRKRIWPADTFVDFEHGLYSAVQRLRDALGDTAETPRFVETLPRRGYRFIGVLESEAKNSDVGAVVATATSYDAQLKNKILPSARRRSFASGVATASMLAAFLLVAFNSNLGGARSHRSGGESAGAIRSLAIVPFRNVSDDPSQTYIGEAIADELFTTLSQIPQLRVVSQPSVTKTTKSLPEIARELGVNGVLEGSVERKGDRIYVTVRFMSANNDKNIWTQDYERQMQDASTLHSAIAESVLRELKVPPKSAETAVLADLHPARERRSPNAVNAFHAGIYLLNTASNEEYFEKGEEASPKDLKAAIGFFEQAIREDPTYAAAYIGLADALVLNNGPRDLRDEPRARASAWKALSIDNTLPAAHVSVANHLRLFDQAWIAAEHELKIAVDSSPNSAEAHAAYAEFLDQTGRFEEGWKEQQRRQQLNPNHESLAHAYFRRHRFEMALEENTKWLQDVPGDGWGMFYRGAFYERAGMKSQAIMQWIDLMNYLECKDCAEALRRNYHRRGYVPALRAWAKTIEETEKRKWWPRDVLAYVYALTGETDRALAVLEKAFSEKDTCVLEFKVSPFWDSLRPEPRFRRLIDLAGFNDAPNADPSLPALLHTAN